MNSPRLKSRCTGIATFVLTTFMLWPGASLEAEDEKSPLPRELPNEPMDVPSVQAVPVDAAIRISIDDAIKQKDFPGAENQLVKLIEQNPNSPQLLAFLGRVLFLDQKYLNAAVAFKKAEKMGPLKEEDHFTLSMCFVVLNRKDWAKQELEKLMQAHMKNPRYPYWLARLDYDDMQYASAVEKLKKALELDPGLVKAYDNLGLSYEGLGQFDLAAKSYQKANELNHQQTSKSAWVPLNYGTFLLNEGKLAEAEPLLREAAIYDPKLPQARFQLGLLLEKKKQYTPAIEELNAAITLDPTYPEPHYVLAKIFRTTGDLKSAEASAKTFQNLKDRKQSKKSQ